MSNRHIVAAEMQALIEQLQQLCSRAERLAESSGGMVDAKWFRGAHCNITMAVGQLDQQGLLQPHPAPVDIGQGG